MKSLIVLVSLVFVLFLNRNISFPFHFSMPFVFGVLVLVGALCLTKR